MLFSNKFQALFRNIIILFFTGILVACGDSLKELRVTSTTLIEKTSVIQQQNTPTIIPWASPTWTIFVLPPNITPIPEEYWSSLENFSPDGIWKVSLDYPFAVSVTSLQTKKILQDLAPQTIPFTPGIIPRSYYLESWFPDSTGFIVYDVDSGYEKSAYDRLIIYQIETSQNKLQRYIFEPLEERNTAISGSVSYSPDSSLFAVIVNSQEIFILNRKAEVIQKFKPKLNNNSIITNIDWTKYGLLYEVRRTQSNDKVFQESELRIINIDEQNQSDDLLLSISGFDIVSVDPYSTRLVIYTSTKREIIIFNFQTLQFEEVLCKNIEYGYCKVVNTNNQRIFAIRNGKDGDNLYIFDWETRQLINKKYHIEEIIDWREDKQSFIVLQGEYPNTWFEFIEP